MAGNPTIGRREAVGIGIETTPGVAVAPQTFARQAALTLDQKTTTIDNTTALGRIENISDSAVVERWTEGSLNGYVSDAVIGYPLLNIFAAVTPTLHSGETTVYDNLFSVSSTALPPTLTIARSNTVATRRHAMAMLSDLEIDIKQNDWVQFTATLQAMVGANSTETVVYPTENLFHSKYVTTKLASSVAGLSTAQLATPVVNTPTTATTGGTLAAGTYYYVITATNASGETVRSNEVSQVTTGAASTVTFTWAAITGATGYTIYRGSTTGNEQKLTTVGAVTTFTDNGSFTITAVTPPTTNTTAAAPLQIKSLKLKISRKIERFTPVGTIDPVSFDPNVFSVTGTIVARYTDTVLENVALNNTIQAMSIALVNTDTTIGTATNPSLTFTLPQVRFDPQTLDNKLDQTLSQTFNFNAELSTSAAYMIQAVLTNTKNGYAHA